MPHHPDETYPITHQNHHLLGFSDRLKGLFLPTDHVIDKSRQGITKRRFRIFRQ